jgi:hypothetical protein
MILARNYDSDVQNAQENLSLVDPTMPSPGVTAMPPFI